MAAVKVVTSGYVDGEAALTTESCEAFGGIYLDLKAIPGESSWLGDLEDGIMPRDSSTRQFLAFHDVHALERNWKTLEDICQVVFNRSGKKLAYRERQGVDFDREDQLKIGVGTPVGKNRFQRLIGSLMSLT